MLKQQTSPQMEIVLIILDVKEIKVRSKSELTNIV